MRCKSSDIIPIGLRLKTQFNTHRTSKIALRASRALLRDRIHFYWAKTSALIQHIRKQVDHLRGIVGPVDQQRIFKAVESFFRHTFRKQKDNHIRKFSILISERSRNLRTFSSFFDHKKLRSGYDMLCEVRSGEHRLCQIKSGKFRLYQDNTD
jgi:hypothetical protein